MNARGITVEPVSVSVLLTSTLSPVVGSTSRWYVPLVLMWSLRATCRTSSGLIASDTIRSSSRDSMKSAKSVCFIARPSSAVQVIHSCERGQA